MISVLIDAALRSLFVGLVVVCGMRAFRIRNVLAQKTALGLVLVSALAMPLVIPIAQRLQVLPAKASIVLPRTSHDLARRAADKNPGQEWLFQDSQAGRNESA